MTDKIDEALKHARGFVTEVVFKTAQVVLAAAEKSS